MRITTKQVEPPPTLLLNVVGSGIIGTGAITSTWSVGSTSCVQFSYGHDSLHMPLTTGRQITDDLELVACDICTHIKKIVNYHNNSHIYLIDMTTNTFKATQTALNQITEWISDNAHIINIYNRIHGIGVMIGIDIDGIWIFSKYLATYSFNIEFSNVTTTDHVLISNPTAIDIAIRIIIDRLKINYENEMGAL